MQYTVLTNLIRGSSCRRRGGAIVGGPAYTTRRDWSTGNMASKREHLKSVDSPPAGPTRATTTSFRIPTYWYNRARDEAKRLDISLSQMYLRALTHYFGTFEASAWETDDDPDSYDSTRFYTHSEDRKGHSFHVRTNIPKPLAGELSSLVQSGMVPAYRSIGDVARDAIYHRTKQIAQMIDNGELEQTVDMAMLLSDELQIMDEAEHAQQLIETLRANAQSMFSRDSSPARLKKYLAQRREIASSIPEQYRPDYIAVIEDYEKRVSKVEKKNTRRR